MRRPEQTLDGLDRGARLPAARRRVDRADTLQTRPNTTQVRRLPPGGLGAGRRDLPQGPRVTQNARVVGGTLLPDGLHQDRGIRLREPGLAHEGFTPARSHVVGDSCQSLEPLAGFGQRVNRFLERHGTGLRQQPPDARAEVQGPDWKPMDQQVPGGRRHRVPLAMGSSRGRKITIACAMLHGNCYIHRWSHRGGAKEVAREAGADARQSS